jgi:hypothetical protein
MFIQSLISKAVSTGMFHFGAFRLTVVCPVGHLRGFEVPLLVGEGKDQEGAVDERDD